MHFTADAQSTNYLVIADFFDCKSYIPVFNIGISPNFFNVFKGLGMKQLSMKKPGMKKLGMRPGMKPSMMTGIKVGINA